MKGKIPKMLRVGLALVLALSLCLVMAVPAAVMGQGSSTYAGYTFGSGGTVTWDETTKDTGNYSVKLDEDATALTYVEFIPAPGTTMSDLDAGVIAEWSFRYHMITQTSGGPNMELRFTSPTFDADTGAEGNAFWGHADVNTQVPVGLTPGEWATEDAVTNPQVQTYFNDPVNGTAGAFDSSPFYLLSETLAKIDDDVVMTTHGSSAADWELTRVRIELADSTNRVCYIDDVTIDGVTYDLEPIALDTAHPYFYTGGSTVTVTVPHAGANADPNRADTVTVDVTSTSDGIGFRSATDNAVVLTETGANTGVFQGSVPTTLAIPPGAGELVVADGDNITVGYDGEDDLGADWGAGDQNITITATVDDSKPTITNLTTDPEPDVADIVYSLEPTISADLDDVGSDINISTVVMTVNGVSVTPTSVTVDAVSYNHPALLPGTPVTVTIDVDDNMGNSATRASLSFTIADKFNVGSSHPSIPAADSTSVTVTFTDAAENGPDGTGDGHANLLNTVKVTLSGPGVDLASGDYYYFGGTEVAKGGAASGTATSLTFSVTPEQAGTITVTVVGTFDTTVPITPAATEELLVSVTGYLVEEEWADVGMETTDAISLRVTTKAGVAVNTGIVTITAALADGFAKDVDPLVEGDESFQTIEINGDTGEITYGEANAEDFLVSDGNYEVTGITFANIGDVDILVEDAGSNDKASFDTAFTVLGIEVYDLSFDLATLTAGVDATGLEITITDNSLDDAPVTDVASIKVDGATATFSGPVDNVYTVTDELRYTEVDILSVTASNLDGSKYGSADLEVELPTLTAVISEGTDVRDLMLVGAAYDYTIAVTALDAQGEPLALGQVWLGTYELIGEVFTFTALGTTGGTPAGPADAMPLVLDADGLGDLVIAQTSGNGELLSVGTLVWKVSDDGATVGTAALLSTPTIAVETPEYTLDWIPAAPEVGEEITFTVTDNYGVAAGDINIIIVSPGGDPIEKVTTPEGKFKYTATEDGNYYVSVGEQDPVTVTVVVTRLASIAAAPESVDLYVEETEDLVITATYEDTSEAGVTADATYVSSDETVATVDAGLITAVAEGTATITVTYTEGVITKTADVLVTVSEVPVLVSIAASPSEVPRIYVGETQQLTITAIYSDLSDDDVTATATYASDAESVATVSEAGLIEAVTAGEATITVSYTEDEITVTTDVSVTVTEVVSLTIQLYEGANPILYTGVTMDLPGALTNISEITEVIWQRDVSTAGEWWYYLVALDHGQVSQLENDTVYIIVVSEDCIWELSQ